jgi:intracellular septation protein A
MKLWTYRFKPVIDGHLIPVVLEMTWTSMRLIAPASVHHPTLEPLQASGGATASVVDHLNLYQAPYRLQSVEVAAPGGAVQVTTGPRSWWTYGASVTRNGHILWQSHPNPHGALDKIQAVLNSRKGLQGDQPSLDIGVFRRNGPAIGTDIALGLLFFLLGKTTDLRTAALVTAGVGLALVPIQWLINRYSPRKIDLLGGLALFGVLMMLLSAGFSWYFESEFAVQLKATVMGCIGATAFALDAMFGGRYMARRLSTYLAYRDLNSRRLSIGMALCGYALAGINLAVALSFSKNTWLYYTTWGDMVVVILLTQWAINWARRG